MGTTAWADTTLDRDYLIDHWRIGDLQECDSSDTLTFYERGAWAVTNGGSNPVEAISLWQPEGTTVKIFASDLKDAKTYDALDAEISEVTADSFFMTAKPLQGRSITSLPLQLLISSIKVR